MTIVLSFSPRIYLMRIVNRKYSNVQIIEHRPQYNKHVIFPWFYVMSDICAPVRNCMYRVSFSSCDSVVVEVVVVVVKIVVIMY